MNRFQQELARQLPKYNCTIQYDNNTGRMKVINDGCELCNIHPNRDVTYRSENHLKHEQREQLGIDMGLELLADCGELHYFGDSISQGMAAEII